MASAELDARLSSMVGDLSIGYDITWLAFGGRNTTWMRETLQTMLAHQSECGPKRAEEEDVESLRAVLGRVARLQEIRDRVVHGTWGEQPSSDAEGRAPRPYDDKQNGDPIIWCFKSRLLNGPTASAFTVADLERLAREIESTGEDAWSLWCTHFSG